MTCPAIRNHAISWSLDQATADRLLDGSGAGPLSDLLTAARAPGSVAELAGEAAALAEFRAATEAAALSRRDAASPRRHEAPGQRSVLRRFITVKAASIAAAVLLGGVAVAATTGVLPLPLGPAPVTSSSGSAVPNPSTPTRPSEGSTPGSPDPSTTPTGPASPGATATPGAGVGPSPTAALVGLCRAYLAHVASKPDKPWDNPAYAVLLAAAGGDDQVLPFCTQLVAADNAHPTPARTATTTGRRRRRPDPNSRPVMRAAHPRHADRPVFHDRTGRRRRAVTVVLASVAVGMVATLGTLVLALTGTSPVPLPGFPDATRNANREPGVTTPAPTRTQDLTAPGAAATPAAEPTPAAPTTTKRGHSPTHTPAHPNPTKSK